MTARQRRRYVLSGNGVTPVAVVWEPTDAAALARDLAALTGRPADTLPAHLQEKN